MFKKEKKKVLGKKIKNQTSGSGLLLILYNNSYRRKEKGTEGRKEQEKKSGRGLLLILWLGKNGHLFSCRLVQLSQDRLRLFDQSSTGATGVLVPVHIDSIGLENHLSQDSLAQFLVVKGSGPGVRGGVRNVFLTHRPEGGAKVAGQPLHLLIGRPKSTKTRGR